MLSKIISKIFPSNTTVAAESNENDLVLYYTDGVIDTSNSLGQRFDEERLIKTLTKLCKQSYTSQEILNKLFKKLDDFTGQNRHLEDDASMVIFQLK